MAPVCVERNADCRWNPVPDSELRTRDNGLCGCILKAFEVGEVGEGGTAGEGDLLSRDRCWTEEDMPPVRVDGKGSCPIELRCPLLGEFGKFNERGLADIVEVAG